MIIITSPAKRLDFSKNWKSEITSIPVFNKQADIIAKVLKSYSIEDLSKKLHISQNLAELNYNRFQSWDSNVKDNKKPAILAYIGDVHKEIKIELLTKKDFKYLQNNLRIITGMYGLLRPYDLIQAYRLEMKIKLGEEQVNNLYDFWTELITNEINNQLKKDGHQFVVNLASGEYSKVINKSELSKPLINIKFTQERNGVVKSIGILNKRARGQMIRFAAQTNAKTISDLEKFNSSGYKLVSKTDDELVFLK